MARILNEKGQVVKDFDLKPLMEEVAAAAAKGAIEGADGVSGNKQTAADSARQSVEDLL